MRVVQSIKPRVLFFDIAACTAGGIGSSVCVGLFLLGFVVEEQDIVTAMLFFVEETLG